MTAQKQTSSAAGASPQSPGSRASARRPWKKKTPVEVVLDQADKLREQITEKEDELKTLKKQLQKFEEARKIFESI